MGIEVTYRRLKKAKWTRLQKDRKKASSFLFSFLPGLDVAAASDLLSNPELLESKCDDILAAMENAENDPTRVDLEKHWHALHFLLSGDSSMNPEHMPEEPLHNVVLGGHPTKFKGGYGPVRCFEVDEVRDIARALSRISVNDLRRGFSARAFNDEEIYPNPRPGGWSCREVEGVFQVFLSSLDFLKTQPQPARSFSFMPHDR